MGMHQLLAVSTPVGVMLLRPGEGGRGVRPHPGVPSAIPSPRTRVTSAHARPGCLVLYVPSPLTLSADSHAQGGARVPSARGRVGIWGCAHWGLICGNLVGHDAGGGAGVPCVTSNKKVRARPAPGCPAHCQALHTGIDVYTHVCTYMCTQPPRSFKQAHIYTQQVFTHT